MKKWVKVTVLDTLDFYEGNCYYSQNRDKRSFLGLKSTLFDFSQNNPLYVFLKLHEMKGITKAVFWYFLKTFDYTQNWEYGSISGSKMKTFYLFFKYVH